MPSPLLNIAVVQTALVWQDANANLNQLTHWCAEGAGADVLVLPEMFNSGFSMQPERFAESMDGPTMQALCHAAATYQLAICGSLAIQTADGYVNRLVFVTPSGEVQHYDKRHLFRMGAEHQHYQAGHERVVVSYRGWRLLLQICYDLRFPVFARNQQDYDVALYVANWPAPRAGIWRTLLSARAIENQAYVIGCNRVGEDDNGLVYQGDSLVLDFVGEPLASLPPATSGLLRATLDMQALTQFRQQFPAALDADAFELR